ncbi:molybdopterin cofactor-binding domain-containing protein [Sphingomonas cavernae]|uniref:Xanthine dehydrogenase family protein molybdopterin-binding subunit n=1 Tax=Sphingomonas cavernae TaxID=2320861 RepID=A0A418WS09_9SPHN|nr:molybdopterin cofactor-binding domain-containing protein [Sphingomonas cavernae]RJF94042.1 xanthine dehydrogenase family protein molybdopterin-binding subunit [Sphingomonas cavernae]
MALWDELKARGGGLSRRQILVGGGVGIGLVVGWAVWPRAYAPNLVANPAETIFNAFLKIAADGRVTVAVPQGEFGQGSYTALPQILADELGADWRTIAVEAAPISPVYANRLLAGDAVEGQAEGLLSGISRWAVQEFATRESLMVTGFSSSIRAFEKPLREAGAAARVLLCKAAARRWDADWLACDTAEGFVVRGEERLRFGELTQEALDFKIPDPVPLRTGRENRLVARSLPRLDLPAKIDGTATFAADVRLPDMAYAAIRQGPLGEARLIGYDRKAADAQPGVLGVVDTPHWVAAIATNWWAANRALDEMKPRFAVGGARASTARITETLQKAMDGDGVRITKQGDLAAVYRGQTIHTADYSVGLAAHAPMETMTATARLKRGALELWIATQTPALARAEAARALGMDENDVVIHPVLGGGAFGHRLENEIAGQVAILAARMSRPVQLTWSRAEDLTHDRFRPPAFARMSAKFGPTGLIEGWLAKIAAPSTAVEQARRMFAGHGTARTFLPDPASADPHAVAGALPPYGIPAFAVDHHPAEIGVPTGYWRSGAHSYTAFFTECFIDELALMSGIEPLSFRMQLLGSNPRLAHCLATVAALAGWQGGVQGSGQGIACHSMADSHVALVAEAHVDGSQKVVVDRVTAVVDCGRVINPDLVRQQIEGGILFGIAAATGAAIDIKDGMVVPRNFAQLEFPVLANSPQIGIELVRSQAPSGGVSEIAVPPIAPAVANAIAAANGQRLRSLPLVPGAV